MTEHIQRSGRVAEDVGCPSVDELVQLGGRILTSGHTSISDQ